jgi:hypothetical protein
VSYSEQQRTSGTGGLIILLLALAALAWLFL